MIMPPLRQHHLLMVHMEPGAAQHIPLPIEKGYILHVSASYIDAHTGEKVGETRLHLSGPQELHFTASSKEIFQGYYYLQEWDRLGKAYTCTCLEHKQIGFCQHIEQLDPMFTVA